MNVHWIICYFTEKWGLNLNSQFLKIQVSPIDRSRTFEKYADLNNLKQIIKTKSGPDPFLYKSLCSGPVLTQAQVTTSGGVHGKR
jgi:hypothetical protein